MIDEPILQPFFENVFRETMACLDIKSEVEFIYDFFGEWSSNFVHPLGDNLLTLKRLDNSLFHAYLASQSNTFEWLSVTLLCGNYDIVMRELRTILEILFPAYAIDIKNPEKTMEDKLILLQEIENSRDGYGKPVFAKSGIEEWEYFYSLYRKLCSYTHLSYQVTGKGIQQVVDEQFSEITDVRFNKTRFLNCVEIWKEVTKLAIYLAEKLTEGAELIAPEYLSIKRLFDE